MEDEILIALFVQMMIASESVDVPFTNVFEAYRTRVQYLSVYECFEEFHVRPDAASFRRVPLFVNAQRRKAAVEVNDFKHHNRTQCGCAQILPLPKGRITGTIYGGLPD